MYNRIQVMEQRKTTTRLGLSRILLVLLCLLKGIIVECEAPGIAFKYSKVLVSTISSSQVRDQATKHANNV